MSTVSNTLQEPLMDLWGRFNFLNGILLLLENQLNNFRKLFENGLASKKRDLSHVFVGVSLVVSDITGPTDNGWRLCYPAGGFHTQGQDYFRMADVIVRRESAWAVAQGYEAFETFLKNIAARYLHAHQNKAKREKLNKFEINGNSEGRVRSDIKYWQMFVRWKYRGGKNNKELFKLLRGLAPGLADAETTNDRGMDLPKWYEAASVVRHAVTHCHLIVRPDQLHWIEGGASYFPFQIENEAIILNLERKNAEKCLTTFAEYAFQVFKFLSKAGKYDWEILGRKFKVSKVTM